MIKINPVSFASSKKINFQKANFYTSQPLSFKQSTDEYIASIHRKDDEVRQYFETSVFPKSEEKLEQVHQERKNAEILYRKGKNNKFNTCHDLSGNKTIQYERKRKGLAHLTTIKVFDGASLEREIEVSPFGKINIKVFDGSLNNYDYYVTTPSGLHQYWENMSEEKNANNTLKKADKMYEWDCGYLSEYCENYMFSKNKLGKILSIEKRFKPDFDADYLDYEEHVYQIGNRREDVSYKGSTDFSWLESRD